MGKYDKDRFQKELAIRYCLARETIPFLEVITASVSDLSDSIEVLTDLDVVGIESSGDGAQTKTFFDCKSSAKMSAINRAFWAAGVKSYTGFDRAHVILKKPPVTNHRLSALTLNVDLHDENSFRELGRIIDPSFPSDSFYQSSIDRWEMVSDAYVKYAWSPRTFELVRSEIPLSKVPSRTFRQIIAALRETKGQYDPAKPEHLAIFFDVLSSVMVLWASLSQDIRRFYEPNMDRAAFEKVLRYYIWGGKDAYLIRQQLRERAKADVADTAELPAWSLLLDFAGLTVNAPAGSLNGAHVFRELSIRALTGPIAGFDGNLHVKFKADNRLRQFTMAIAEYLVVAGGLPKDMMVAVHGTLSEF